MALVVKSVVKRQAKIKLVDIEAIGREAHDTHKGVCCKT